MTRIHKRIDAQYLLDAIYNNKGANAVITLDEYKKFYRIIYNLKKKNLWTLFFDKGFKNHMAIKRSAFFKDINGGVCVQIIKK